MSDIGTIAEIQPEDGLGWIELDNGDRVRFGGTACKGFVPAIGMTVRVLGTKAGYRGVLKATGLERIKDAPVSHPSSASANEAAAPAPAPAPAAPAPAPRVSAQRMAAAPVRSSALLTAWLERADADDRFFADLTAAGWTARPALAAQVGCHNPWLFAVGHEADGGAFGVYAHPMLVEHPELPWVRWDRAQSTLMAVAADSASFFGGWLASLPARGVDSAVVARLHAVARELGVPEAVGALVETWEAWLPPVGPERRPLDAYLAETDGVEMERGLLAYAWQEQDERALQALRSLYEAWEWTPLG